MSLEKRFNLVMILFLSILLFGIYWMLRPETHELHEDQEFLMDTFITIKVSGPKAEEALQGALEEMRRLEGILSRHIEESDVFKLNQKAGISPQTVEEETMEVLQFARELGALTGGAFDVTIAPLLTLWGFGEQQQQVPEAQQIEALLPLVDYSLLALDEEAMTAYLPVMGMAVDLGGIAKGYIVDQGVQYLKEQGITQALISAGGDIRVFGDRPGGGPWRIGIRDPFGGPDDLLPSILYIHSGSVDTSGSYERFFVEDGVEYHHILDPATGSPAMGMMSTTVLCQSSALADALSTALFVLGLEEGMELITSLEGVEAMMITLEGQQFTSPGFYEKTKPNQ